jgi:hypothetical protein
MRREQFGRKIEMRKKAHVCEFEVVREGPGELRLYVVYDGKRIAERGKPDTPYAKQWISLEPGYVVRDINKDELVVKVYDVTVN